MEILLLISIPLLIGIIFCTTLIFIEIRKKKYSKFLKSNSITLNKLLAVNKKFKFFNNSNCYDDYHTYDNEIFYNLISCEDYLIYQLQFNQNEIIKTIKEINYNKEMYNKYCQELSQINEFGSYKTINKLNKNYLLKIEKKLYNENLLNPRRIFNVEIVLFCSKINGVIYNKKQQIFSADEIMSLIKRLNNKNYGFYNDKKIWDSLCRVERGKVSNKMRFAIYQRDGYRCCICGKEGQYDLEIDHIKPIAKGGKSTFDNLQTLCKECNKNKGDFY